ncbi:hypothetical protein TNCV_3958371 [Trichonephila clavipes]|nr:hypothetical protein TNCV_3958371 [Trichonephila clavipes]
MRGNKLLGVMNQGCISPSWIEESLGFAYNWRKTFVRMLCVYSKVWWRRNYGLGMFLVNDNATCHIARSTSDRYDGKRVNRLDWLIEFRVESYRKPLGRCAAPSKIGESTCLCFRSRVEEIFSVYHPNYAP